ncbi:MAG: hypothetical protein JO002_00495, partial [Burkholderiaceae bacterium]|nr:hypothetical protein [Burkholderiaceae bacterium]
MKLPESISPLLQQITVKRRLPFEFWESDDGNRIMDAFFDLSSGLSISDLDTSKLPRGYTLVRLLFSWEEHCQFSGWSAFSSMEDEMDRVLEAFNEVELPGEAQAVSAAFCAWRSDSGNY